MRPYYKTSKLIFLSLLSQIDDNDISSMKRRKLRSRERVREKLALRIQNFAEAVLKLVRATSRNSVQEYDGKG